LDITKDGSFAYIGGAGQVLRYRLKGRTPCDDSREVVFSTRLLPDFSVKELKCLDQGRVALIEGTTNDFRIYSSSLELLFDLRGTPSTFEGSSG
jgi:hypothetical protein